MIVETHWPEVKSYLAEPLLRDLWVRSSLRAPPEWTFRLTCQRDAQDVMRVYAGEPRLDVWLEANTEDARTLLRTLPSERRMAVLVGTPLGLQLVQEELTGSVRFDGVFCFTDSQRFRPSFTQSAKKLGPEDRDALQRYPDELEITRFDKGWQSYYGSYHAGELVAYATCPWSGDGMVEVEVDVRPEYWGQGYGRSVVSAATADLLKQNEVVLYHATYRDSLASLRLCLAVGFVPLRISFVFEGERQS